LIENAFSQKDHKTVCNFDLNVKNKNYVYSDNMYGCKVQLVKMI